MPADHPQERLQKAVEESMDRLDRNYIRKISKKAYLCMAGCYDQTSLDAHQLQQCVQTCGTKTSEVQQMISTELQYFQNRLQRCSAACEDEARDFQSGVPDIQNNPSKKAEMQKKYEGCINKCVDSHIPLLKKVEDKLASGLKQRL